RGPGLGRGLVQLWKGDADVPGGVVDEDVEAPNLVGCRSDGPVDDRGVRLVELDHAGAAPEALHGPAGLRGAVAIADIAHGDVTACLGERPADGRPQIARAARHQRPASTKVHGDLRPPPSPRLANRRAWPRH